MKSLLIFTADLKDPGATLLVCQPGFSYLGGEKSIMAARRKDPKGRVLKDGESYRKSDNLYTFRYKDVRGKVKAIYDSDLKKLREKEKEVLKAAEDGMNYASGEITVIELVKKYIALKEGVRYNTKVGYNFVQNVLLNHYIYNHRENKPALLSIILLMKSCLNAGNSIQTELHYISFLSLTNSQIVL